MKEMEEQSRNNPEEEDEEYQGKSAFFVIFFFFSSCARPLRPNVPFVKHSFGNIWGDRHFWKKHGVGGVWVFASV